MVNYGIIAVGYNENHKHITEVCIGERKMTNVFSVRKESRNEVISKVKSKFNNVVTIAEIRKGHRTEIHMAEVIVYPLKGKEYIKTVRDDIEEDNLGDLREISPYGRGC